jgi:hypothetical protein
MTTSPTPARRLSYSDNELIHFPPNHYCPQSLACVPAILLLFYPERTPSLSVLMDKKTIGYIEYYGYQLRCHIRIGGTRSRHVVIVMRCCKAGSLAQDRHKTSFNTVVT